MAKVWLSVFWHLVRWLEHLTFVEFTLFVVVFCFFFLKKKGKYKLLWHDAQVPVYDILLNYILYFQFSSGWIIWPWTGQLCSISYGHQFVFTVWPWSSQRYSLGTSLHFVSLFVGFLHSTLGKVQHWYFISAMDIWCKSTGKIVDKCSC